MASAKADKQRPHRRTWRKNLQRFSHQLNCCSCWCSEKDPLQEQEKKINGGPVQLPSDQRGSGEKEAIQITVEDLGIVNAGFSLLDEDFLTPRNNMGRSASSVSACPRALKKKRLKPLSSLPIPSQTELAHTSSTGEDDELEDDDTLQLESNTDSLLASPVINLIPPTPSDVIDDDQFFDISSEGSVANTSDEIFAGADQESWEEKMENVEEPKEGCILAGRKAMADCEAEPKEVWRDEPGEQREAVLIKNEEKEKTKPYEFLRSAYHVAPLPEYPQRRSVNTGINHLSFTEHNLDDLSNRDFSCSHMLMSELCLSPKTTTMDTFTHQRRPITRSCSLGGTLTRSSTFHALLFPRNQEQEASPRQRRITVASYMPHSTDQNGNFPEKISPRGSHLDQDRQAAKSLKDLNTEEVCQWFASIGLKKCLPFIRESQLCGADMASVDENTLDILHISTLEDREQLLSAIYNQLHPPSIVTQSLNPLLGPKNAETFTAKTGSMTKSKSSPHVSCLSMNQRSLKLRNISQNPMPQKNAQLIEITINASERIVHLRTPKETTVGKIMDSCIKMLGMTEDKHLFIMKEKEGSPEELSPDQQIGTLLTSSSENRQLELHLCKMDKPATSASQNGPEDNKSSENGNSNTQENHLAKEERIRELNQQVESLQNVILQVQELHHGLVAFCSELKSMYGDVNVDRLSAAELKQRLDLVNSRLHDQRQNLQSFRDDVNNSAAHKKKQSEVRLLEKMKLNCQIFKGEISMVHLNRHAAHLQSALQESCIKEKARRKTLAIGSLSQLVSPQSPAMLLVVQENRSPDGHYGFTCGYRDGSGLVVVKADNSDLCVDDRLMEVNGVPVVNATEEELSELLLQGPSAHIVVLRHPLTTPTSPLLLQHMVNPDPVQTICPDRDVVNTDAPPPRKAVAT